MTTNTSDRGRSIAPDEILSAVADEHRRAVLRSLDHTDGTVLAVSTLVDRVADRIQDGHTLDDGRRQRLHTALHHVHLPKLEACGMIVYNPDTKQVETVTDELTDELVAMVEAYETAE